jgi:hypothetical protein
VEAARGEAVGPPKRETGNDIHRASQHPQAALEGATHVILAFFDTMLIHCRGHPSLVMVKIYEKLKMMF